MMPCVPHGPQPWAHRRTKRAWLHAPRAAERGARPQVTATLRFGDVLQAADMVCSTAFDRDDDFFATAGVSRRIKARRRPPAPPAAGARPRGAVSQRGGAQRRELDCGEGGLSDCGPPSPRAKLARIGC
jgi:hypothetical protein